MDPNKPSGLKKPGFSQASRLPTLSGPKTPGTPSSSSASGVNQATSSSSNLDKSSTSSMTSIKSIDSSENSKSIESKLPTSSSSATIAAKRASLAETKEARSLAASSKATPMSDAGPDESNNEIGALKNTIKDLNEKLETLKLKRSEDREKLREFDKFKLQIQQLQEFKTKAQELISNQNKELQQTKQEAKQIKDQFDAYKDEMSNHEQRIEEMTVDKELAEAKVEEMQENEQKLNEKLEELKLELEVLKSEIELNGVDGAAASFQSKQIEKEHETLKAALIKLRDLSLQDKSEINSLRKLNEESQTKLKNLSKENETLKEEKSANLIQINELKDQVTSTLGSVQMIEQLTEQNLDLEAKLIELKDTIADLEEINEVNDQLQENAREEEKELRQSLDLAENRIREAEKQIESLKYNIADNEKTILKFRELVKQIQNDNDSLTRQLKSKIEEEKANNSLGSQSTSTFDFKQKFIETKNLAMIIENEVNKIELTSQKKYVNYLLSFMSEVFLKRAGDNECVLTLLFFKRISNKSDLILKHVKDKILNINTDAASKANTQGQLKFLYEISIFVENIKLISNKFDFILNNCDSSIYINIGQMYFDFSLHEKTLDIFIDLLQKDQLDENINLESIEKMCNYFQTIYKNYLSSEKLDEISYLNDLYNFGNFCTESISIDLQRLNTLTEAKDETSEIILLFKELNTKNEELKQTLKKVYKNIPKDEKIKNKFILTFSSELVNQLENCIQDFYLLSKTLKELYVLASNSKMFLANDTNESLSAKKLENFAYQVCDKTYLKEDNGPYENLRNSIDYLIQTLTTMNVSLENGEFEKELSDEEYKIRKYMINSPALKAAEKYKNTLIEAEAIKYKLETKEDEIKELKKSYKLKADELSEQKLRISLVEKKAEDAQKELEEKDKRLNQTIEELKSVSLKKEKEHSETLEALQQEVDTLQSERRDLKEKLRSTTKKNLFENIINQHSMSSSNAPNLENSFKSNSNNSFSGSLDSPALIEELRQVKNLNKILQKQCVEMRQSLSQQMLASLPPLPSITTSSIKEQPFESNKNVDASNAKDKENENISNLMKNSKNLVKDVYSQFANIKVQNLKNENQRKKEMDKTYLSSIEIENKIVKIQTLLSNHRSENLHQRDKQLVAEIDLFLNTNANPSQKVIDLSLNKSEIKELLRSI